MKRLLPLVLIGLMIGIGCADVRIKEIELTPPSEETDSLNAYIVWSGKPNKTLHFVWMKESFLYAPEQVDEITVETNYTGEGVWNVWLYPEDAKYESAIDKYWIEVYDDEGKLLKKSEKEFGLRWKEP